MKMAKAKSTQKLSKTEIDTNIKRLWLIDEEQDKLNKEAKAIRVLLESQYQLPAEQKEVIYGNETYMEKTPVDNGKNTYDAEKLKPFLKAIRVAIGKIIKKVEIVDTKALDELVKIGKLPPEALDTCRVSKWTFRSMFKRIESAVQGQDTGAEEPAKVTPINKAV
jgi:hypothetical protein